MYVTNKCDHMAQSTALQFCQRETNLMSFNPNGTWKVLEKTFLKIHHVHQIKCVFKPYF